MKDLKNTSIEVFDLYWLPSQVLITLLSLHSNLNEEPIFHSIDSIQTSNLSASSNILSSSSFENSLKPLSSRSISSYSLTHYQFNSIKTTLLQYLLAFFPYLPIYLLFLVSHLSRFFEFKMLSKISSIMICQLETNRNRIKTGFWFSFIFHSIWFQSNVKSTGTFVWSNESGSRYGRLWIDSCFPTCWCYYKSEFDVFDLIEEWLIVWKLLFNQSIVVLLVVLLSMVK